MLQSESRRGAYIRPKLAALPLRLLPPVPQTQHTVPTLSPSAQSLKDRLMHLVSARSTCSAPPQHSNTHPDAWAHGFGLDRKAACLSTGAGAPYALHLLPVL